MHINQTLVPVQLVVEPNARTAIDRAGIIMSDVGIDVSGIITNGNYNGTVGAITPSTGVFTNIIASSATISDVTFIETLVNRVTNYNVLAADSGKIFTTIGSSGEVDFTLPTNSSGLRYTFIVGVAHILKIIANTGSTLSLADSISATSGNMTSSTIYSSITMVSIVSNNWVALQSTGAWTVT